MESDQRPGADEPLVSGDRGDRTDSGRCDAVHLPGEAPIEGTRDGEILEFDPPRVYAFRWNTDVLRFELVPDGDGCRRYFSQTLGGGSIGRLGAARNAAGWDHCLGSLHALLDGREADAFADWLPAMEHYIAVFGLGEGGLTETADGFELHFSRDLVWKPADDVWRLLVEDGTGAARRAGAGAGNQRARASRGSHRRRGTASVGIRVGTRRAAG